MLLNRLTGQAHVQLCVSLQTASTVHYVHQVDGGPGEGHSVAAEPLAELLRLTAQLFQLLFILQKKHLIQKYNRCGRQISLLKK